MATAASISTYDVKGMREDLSEMISDLSPMETPFLSGLGDGGDVGNTTIEWQVDELEAVDRDNAKPEGWTATYSQPSQPERVGNRTQISAKTLQVTRTTEQVTLAGRESEYDRQITKRGKELKIDQEAILLNNQAGSAATRTTARKLASLPSWVKTIVSKAADGTNPTYTDGVPDGDNAFTAGEGRNDGTARAMTEVIVQDVMQEHYDQSSDRPTTLMLGSFNKRRASAVLTGIADRRLTADAMSPEVLAAVGAIDIYVSDFGTLSIIPNRWQRGKDGWFINWDMVKLAVLQPYMTEKLAKIGDFENAMMITEYTLVVINEAGLGLAADLTVAA